MEQARIDAALKLAETAYQGYASFLQDQVLPRSDGRFAAGKELFRYLLMHDYFLKESPDELYAMGERLGWRSKRQLTEGRAPHRSEDQKLATSRRPPEGESSTGRPARRFLPHGSGARQKVLGREGCRRVSAWRRARRHRDAGVSTQHDHRRVRSPPPFDPVTKGFFFVTPVDTSLPKREQEQMLREHDHGDQVDTAVHEAYPGHHLQLSFARRHPSLIRKALGPAIFAEGWALYTEELMAELDYYTDEERLFQLVWALVRAARIMIDVGLHTRGMSFDEAVSILTDKVRLERPLALSEVKRYTQNPTQPLSYMTGRQMIFKLRERYKAREGTRFTLKRFHSDVLARGTVAPSLLGSEMFGD